ncbi:CocE/NonD family hydrolase [Agrobacterium tumefaciens]|uniref:CocE/NonD family hydrolase n=1 Tax=Agrobacterium tumefaciens TaxID=358 RepID=UPI0022435F6A|nr:CocE/NonD family hydrolase [Agrobacterium tumefaciens]MCW8060550.1 CocE/NonD family hydrolase [Agrobacterium tumefaciens]MCW8145993.1 CocE/NonD family hydrolase [Agrobacterium tumefaciens]
MSDVSFKTVADGVVMVSNVMVAMRDGVPLAADIFLPARAGERTSEAFPVILERTPYDKTATPRTEFSLARPERMSRLELAVHFVQRGYAVVWQDCRGRFQSEGHFTKYLSEGEDGYDTMAWITEQSWCNGRIGTMGLSYAAHTQMAMACLNPPGLACMVLDSGGFSNAFTCGIRQGGAFELKQATWAYNRASEGTTEAIAAAVKAENLHDWFAMMPWGYNRSPIRWNPEYEDYLLEQWQHGTFDDFWKKVGIYAAGHYETFPKVPITFMSSWLDVYVPSTLENFAGLKGDPARPLSLIMGPWTHGNRSGSVFGDVDFGAKAPFDGQVDDDWLTYRTRWFDRWLKTDTMAEYDRSEDAPVRIFMMGGGSGRKTEEGHIEHGGQWLNGSDWPLPNTKPLELFLNSDMSLSSQAGERAAMTYDFDPENPVPTIGGALTSGEPIFTGGGFDQVEAFGFFGCTRPGLPLTARHDVLSFETGELSEDLAVVGPVEVSLWVSSDAPDTDFTAKLVDVYPPSPDYPRGYALNISDGIFRCRYRNGFDKPEAMASGEMFAITITPFATANLFRKGHRLRLDISSSNFPKFDVNPNTGEAEGTSRCKRVARNTVYVGEHMPSREGGTSQARISSLKLQIIKE